MTDLQPAARWLARGMLGVLFTLFASAPWSQADAQNPSKAAAAVNGTDALGWIKFPVTGSPACQRLFRRGMLEMHSFQYDEAHGSFAAALAADPACAMAAWGDAMAYNHPLWAQRDAAKGRAALERIGDEKRLSPKERAYISTARSLFDSSDRKAAQRAWLESAAAMYERWPGDDEVALQYALALIAVYEDEPGRQRELSRAAAIGFDVARRNPRHPGAVHYVIHAFDNPDHASLALPAAQAYARIAPASAHALHMPSHTFAQLGMWREMVSSNERAFAASKASAKRRGESSATWDWHAYGWLVAAHLELGQIKRARQLLDQAHNLLATEDSAHLRIGYLDVVANYLAQSDRWQEAAVLTAPLLAPTSEEKSNPDRVACADHAPGGTGLEREPYVLQARYVAHQLLAEAAIRAGDPAAATQRVNDMRAVMEQMTPWTGQALPPRRLARIAEIEARARAASTATTEAQQEAINAIRRLADMEAKSPPVGPAFFLTARERLAQALLAAGRPGEALIEFELVINQRPNRSVSMLGAARAASAAGDQKKARAHYEHLAKLWKDADPSSPHLAEMHAVKP